MNPLAPLAVLALLLASAPDTQVVQPVPFHTASQGPWQLEWLSRDGGVTCAGMRFLHQGKPLEGVTRFLDTCSLVQDAFSPQGAHVVFQVSSTGPIHVVPTADLTAYLAGNGLPDAVVYPSPQAGMPPNPPRRLEFLGWQGPGAFELAGACCGAAWRFTFVLLGSRMVETCMKTAREEKCQVPSPDAPFTAVVTSQGTHVVPNQDLPAFRQGRSKGVLIPAASFKGAQLPVFQAWEPHGRLRFAAETPQSASTFYFDANSGAFTQGPAVDWHMRDPG